MVVPLLISLNGNCCGLNCVPTKGNVVVLTTYTSEWDLCGNRAIVDVKLRSHWTQVGPNPI